MQSCCLASGWHDAIDMPYTLFVRWLMLNDNGMYMKPPVSLSGCWS